MYRVECLDKVIASEMAEHVVDKILYETSKPNAEVYPAWAVAGRLRAIGCKDTAKAIETLSPVLRF